MLKTDTSEDGSPVTVLPADDCLINTELAARICDMSAWSPCASASLVATVLASCGWLPTKSPSEFAT
jgi:hypothetical protein